MDIRPYLLTVGPEDEVFYRLMKALAERQGSILVPSGVILLPEKNERILVLSKKDAHDKCLFLESNGVISRDEARILHLQIDESALVGDLEEEIRKKVAERRQATATN